MSNNSSASTLKFFSLYRVLPALILTLISVPAASQVTIGAEQFVRETSGRLLEVVNREREYYDEIGRAHV